MDAKGQISWGVEVEPPEDMDETHYDIDPRMKIWKNMAGGGQDKQPLKAEEDLDEMYHPSVADLVGAFPADDIQAEPSQEGGDTKYNQEPEEDKDDIDHPAFSHVAPEETEKDWDEVYHIAYPVQAEPLRREVIVHLQPEEDMDDLYHKDPLQPVFYEDDAQPAAPADVPSQRKYSEPEDDLDELYHQWSTQPAYIFIISNHIHDKL